MSVLCMVPWEFSQVLKFNINIYNHLDNSLQRILIFVMLLMAMKYTDKHGVADHNLKFFIFAMMHIEEKPFISCSAWSAFDHTLIVATLSLLSQIWEWSVLSILFYHVNAQGLILRKASVTRRTSLQLVSVPVLAHHHVGLCIVDLLLLL